MRQQIRLRRHRLFKTTLWKTRLIFWGGAVLVGIVAAICGQNDCDPRQLAVTEVQRVLEQRGAKLAV